MFTLHCTAKLRDRIKRPLASMKRPSTTLLGDWYATALFWKPQLALLVNERTLMPILLPLAPASTLPERLGPAVGALLHQYGMALPLIERELAAMTEVDVAKTSNRRVVGTMNEFGFEASIYREDMGATDLAKLSMQLAETRCGAIGHNSPDWLMLEVVSRTHH
jgi:hypothetical protein